MNYADRLALPLDGCCPFALYTRTGILLADGFSRVVIGKRGPYVEFDPVHINQPALRYVDAKHYYFDEVRTADGVMVYDQRKRVDYADYVPGMLYVSPFDLYDEEGRCVIDRPDPRQGRLFE
jgi:hypothetical protein